MKKALTQITLIIFTLFCLSNCDTTTDIDLYGSIEGVVTDEVTKEPINGALVTISPINTSKNTGSDGRYSFVNLEPELYNVQITNEGYETNKKTITVEPGETRNGDVQLAPIIPILHISLSSLDYGSNLTSLPIEISNTGKGELELIVSENVEWISVNPLQGVATTETDNIIVSIDRAGLESGIYEQSISITSNGGVATVIVTLVVQ